jgi:hypothetical protein
VGLTLERVIERELEIAHNEVTVRDDEGAVWTTASAVAAGVIKVVEVASAVFGAVHGVSVSGAVQGSVQVSVESPLVVPGEVVDRGGTIMTLALLMVLVRPGDVVDRGGMMITLALLVAVVVPGDAVDIATM